MSERTPEEHPVSPEPIPPQAEPESPEPETEEKEENKEPAAKGGQTVKSLLLAGAAAAAVLYGAAAMASPITGEISLNGSDTFTSTATSFSITFQNPGNIGGTSGAYQTVFGAVPPQIQNAVTMIGSLSNTTPAGFELFSATANGATATLTAGAISSFAQTPGPPLTSLAVLGTGTLTLTGFDPTPGNFDLTTQGPTGSTANVTFSSTQVPVPTPEPGALGTLGLALVMTGLLFWQRRRQS